MASNLSQDAIQTDLSSPSNKPLQATKSPVQRMLLNVFAVLCIALFAWLALENLNQQATFIFFGQPFPLCLAMVMVIGGFLLSLAALLRLSNTIVSTGKNVKFSQRKIERLEVSAETANERVKAMEQKIQTLEAALKRALNK